jgi:hypothetical protein
MKTINQLLEEGRVVHLAYLKSKKEAQIAEDNRKKLNQTFINKLLRR